MPREPDHVARLSARLAREGAPLVDDTDLDPLVEAAGDSTLALLGEASHGTSEFYTWRARITRRLIQEKGARFVAVEGDWPACRALDRYVRGDPDAAPSAALATRAFDRWPTWMWANREVADFAEWLRNHNRNLPSHERVGFYGLDVYSLWESLEEVLHYLRQHHPDAVEDARRAFQCFQPYGGDVQQYARATVLVPTDCENEVVDLLVRIRQEVQDEPAPAGFHDFDAEQNALVARNAEGYYRAMIRGGAHSWNVRDRHMVETLERLLHWFGPDAKGVAWEHNTHVGDARATDMAGEGMINVGQLVREAHPEDAYVVGFGTHRGTVIAGAAWDAPMERMPVPPAREGSWEDVFHEAGPEDQLLLLDRLEDEDAAFQWRGHRAIGVVYDPRVEAYGNYVPTLLPKRYDAFLHIDRSHALEPLPAPRTWEEAPETYPWGV